MALHMQERAGRVDWAGMAGRIVAAWTLAAALASAQEAPGSAEGLRERLERIERELAEERARGERREQRLRELETALEKATDALARAQDRRELGAEIDAYLEHRGPPAGDREPSRLSIGGVLVLSGRFTDLSGNAPRSNTFQVEERYLRFVYRFSDDLTARYYTDGSLAELEWHFRDWLQLNLGQVIVPFGQFNPRSFPDTFDTLSRPLLYLGDEDTFAQPPNNPRPVFRSIYTDTGVVASGNRWRGADQIYYAVFLTNGLVGTSDLAQGSGFSDNNDNKQIGARLAYTLANPWERSRLGFGVSWLTGKYDTANRLSYRMYGADVVWVVEDLFGGGGSVTVRGEYVYAPREILPPLLGDPTAFLNEASRVQGAYLLVEVRIDARWMVYAEGDWMGRRGPQLMGGGVDPADAGDATANLFRFSFGVVRKFAVGVVWKAEYAFWDFDLGAPDAHRFSTQIVVPF